MPFIKLAKMLSLKLYKIVLQTLYFHRVLIEHEVNVLCEDCQKTNAIVECHQCTGEGIWYLLVMSNGSFRP